MSDDNMNVAAQYIGYKRLVEFSGKLVESGMVIEDDRCLVSVVP